MNTYIVRLRRVMEWEQVYEADSGELALELARLEAHHGTVVDEMSTVEELQPAAQVD